MFLQGYFSTLPCRPDVNQVPPFTVQLDASKFPFPSFIPQLNKVVFSVAAHTSLVLLTGDTSVQGSAGTAHYMNDAVENTSFLPIGRPVVLATGVVHLPPGHNGVVFFTAKSRNMGVDFLRAGEAGSFSLWLEIADNTTPGVTPCNPQFYPLHKSLVAEQPAINDSQRTLSVSYMTWGDNVLAADQDYVVSVCGQANSALSAGFVGLSNFASAVMTLDVPLIWFDADGSPPP
jgi:hypothetical protein